MYNYIKIKQMIEFESQFIDEEALMENYNDGKAYHKRALMFKDQKMPYSLVFNVASIALERYLIALTHLYGEEPKNHNFTILLKSVKPFIEVSADITNRIRKMDLIFGICSIADYNHPSPKEEDMENVLFLCDEINSYVNSPRLEAIMGKASS